ncbi:DeoR family transcriptional regulator [Hydrogenibacillus sp. N12]|uniref:DeoR family transcriptional regulator n=1 Tax=Hydrogenibacillus sp. N12 TaxID=2866627 RepID=UPI001C7DAD28|nr:DeoR family transcriptional regulator [Hydrogenibacillus sp. N12]QZA33800.1 DeoR family transcriptional regulator [Hydrogenibacillus sp. N12]
MLPIERRATIRRLLFERKALKISELSAFFGVSEMTIHRDVRALVDEGIAVKTYGGIALLEPHRKEASPPPSPDDGPSRCVVCGKPVNPTLAYRLLLPDGRVDVACCAHCGLIHHRRLRSTGHAGVYALVRDVLTHTTVPAEEATYVLGGEAPAACCRPPVYAFSASGDAERFARGFGGVALRWAEAADRLKAEMADSGEISAKDLSCFPGTQSVK